MRNRLIYFLSLFLIIDGILTSCGTTKYVPVEGRTETVTNYVDSVRWDVRDSVILVEKSIYKDYVGLLDTLVIESGIAKAKAWADTTHNILNGSLEGKAYVQREAKIEYRDRIVVKKDSVYREKPVPYEVIKEVTKTPKWAYWTLVITLSALFYIGLKIVQKYRRLW